MEACRFSYDATVFSEARKEHCYISTFFQHCQKAVQDYDLLQKAWSKKILLPIVTVNFRSSYVCILSKVTFAVVSHALENLPRPFIRSNILMNPERMVAK